MNLIKKVCKEHTITYKELADEIGYSESSIKSASCRNKIGIRLRKVILLYTEVLELRKLKNL